MNNLWTLLCARTVLMMQHWQIMNKLQSYGLDLSLLCGEGYDDAISMSGGHSRASYTNCMVNILVLCTYTVMRMLYGMS